MASAQKWLDFCCLAVGTYALMICIPGPYRSYSSVSTTQHANSNLLGASHGAEASQIVIANLLINFS